MSGVWTDQEKLLHINLLEMKALFLALQSFQEDVFSHHVTAMCDNSTSHLLRWTESLDIHLDARYLPGQANVLADLLSRRKQVVGSVVSSPSGGEVTTSRLGQPVDRPVCDEPQPRNCLFIARLSWIPRLSSRMRFVILGTTWTCTLSLPFL